MKLLTFILLALMAVKILAEPEPKPSKAFRYQVVDDSLDKNYKNEKLVDPTKKKSASSGRLFMRKFFFNKMFGQNQNQNPPIIPIIVTGGNTPTYTDTNTPTTTSINTNTNTNTNTPTTTITTDTPVIGTATTETIETPIDNQPDTATPTPRFEMYGPESSENNNMPTDEDLAVNDEQTLAADRPAVDEEYTVTNQDIKETSTAKASRAPARINLRVSDGKRTHVVRVRVPEKYRGYFKKGQRVVLNKRKRARPGKRRVIRRRKNRRRNNKNKNKKNKRRRLIAA